MIEVVCPKCSHGLQVPPEAMGQSGTCNHCGSHIELPSLWMYRLTEAWSSTWPVVSTVLGLPFRLMTHLVRVNSRPDEFAGMSQAERMLVKEARKQTKIARASRSDSSCCLGCIIILLLLMFTGVLGPILALFGIAAL